MLLKELLVFAKLDTQISIIRACFALHNYVRRRDTRDLAILGNLENVNQLEAIEKFFMVEIIMIWLIMKNGNNQLKQMLDAWKSY